MQNPRIYVRSPPHSSLPTSPTPAMCLQDPTSPQQQPVGGEEEAACTPASLTFDPALPLEEVKALTELMVGPAGCVAWAWVWVWVYACVCGRGCGCVRV